MTLDLLLLQIENPENYFKIQYLDIWSESFVLFFFLISMFKKNFLMFRIDESFIKVFY